VAAALAEISADGKWYTIKLSANAYFHDGSEMGADDVAISLQRRMRLSPCGALDGEYLFNAVVHRRSDIGATRSIRREPSSAPRDARIQGARPG